MSRQPIDDFFSACEMAGPLRLVTGSVPAVGCESGEFELGRPFAVFGSDPRCDLVLDDPGIEPRHGYLQAFGARVLCLDLGSRNGLDAGKGRASAAWVDGRSGVRVGGRVLRLADENAEPRTPSREVMPLGAVKASGKAPARLPLLAGPLPKVDLEFQANLVQTRWRMKSLIALAGSAHGCSIRLNCPTVTPHHCAFVLTASGLWVVDLLGEIISDDHSGVFVDDVRVRCARVGPEDVVRVGRFRVVARYHESAPPASRRPGGDRLGPEPGSLLKRQFSFGEPPASPVATLDELRREFDARLREMERCHLSEIEELRRELDELRDIVEEVAPWNEFASGAPGPSGRSLGIALRPVRPELRGLGGSGARRGLPHRVLPVVPVHVPAPAAGVAILAGPDFSALDGESDDLWQSGDRGLATATHDARPVG